MESGRNILDVPIVPQKTMKKISELCLEIGKHGTPIYIPSIPEDKIERHDCTRAVKQKIVRDGGEARFGWLIWQWANIVLEASAYIVWKDETGNLFDVTPKETKYESVLFIPASVCDGVKLMNKRIPITDSALIKELVEISDKCETVLQKSTCTSQVDKEVLGNILSYKKRKDEIMRIVSRKAERNELCPCGSGIKYKKCCGYYRSG